MYDAIEQYETCAEFKNKITIPQEVINTVNDDRIEQLSSLILSYKNSVEGVGDIVNNPLKKYFSYRIFYTVKRKAVFGLCKFA